MCSFSVGELFSRLTLVLYNINLVRIPIGIIGLPWPCVVSMHSLLTFGIQMQCLPLLCTLQNFKVVFTLFIVSCMFSKHPVSDWEVTFTMATNEGYSVVNYVAVVKGASTQCLTEQATEMTIKRVKTTLTFFQFTKSVLS